MDGMLGTPTLGGRMEVAVESTELWRHFCFCHIVKSITGIVTIKPGINVTGCVGTFASIMLFGAKYAE